MSYKCLECGLEFEEYEWARWTEPHGEALTGCPKCRGAFEEMKPCRICGREHLPDEMNEGVCDDCVDGCDFETVFSISQNTTKTQVQINDLLATLFEPGDIEAILLEHIRLLNPEIDCSEWINADRGWFADQLAKEVKR